MHGECGNGKKRVVIEKERKFQGMGRIRKCKNGGTDNVEIDE